MCWDASTRRARLWRRQSRRREGLWKRRGLEKSKSRLSHPAWKSRKLRGIPTFPQPRRRQVKLLNRTFHVLQKADILTCYGQRCKNYDSRDSVSTRSGGLLSGSLPLGPRLLRPCGARHVIEPQYGRDRLGILDGAADDHANG